MSTPFTFERQIEDSGLLNSEQVTDFKKLTCSIFRGPAGKQWLTLVTKAISPMGPSIIIGSDGKICTHQTVAFDAVRSTIGYICATANLAAAPTAEE